MSDTNLREIEILRAGAQATLQDLGRRGGFCAGIPLGGAMDRLAARVANWLVGNPDNAVLIETTLAGPDLLFHCDARVAVTGAQFDGIASWQPFDVKAGEVLSLRELLSGCRGYLAVAGGFEVPPVLGGSGTFLRAKLGGHEGRVLRKDDRLKVGNAPQVAPKPLEHWHVSPSILPAYSTQPMVRVVKGAQWSWFRDEARSIFFDQPYAVLPKSDRMGLRLEGARIDLLETREMRSEPVTFGSIQIPPEGQPIVLMADCQTIGGYPRIAEVVTVDLPLLAQLRPGDKVQFVPVSIEEAQTLFIDAEHALSHLHEGLVEKYK
jgi:antagonist of KipI